MSRAKVPMPVSSCMLLRHRTALCEGSNIRNHMGKLVEGCIVANLSILTEPPFHGLIELNL
jgi:hypothetical protein